MAKKPMHPGAEALRDAAKELHRISEVLDNDLATVMANWLERRAKELEGVVFYDHTA